ncbi:hypothetical protein ACFYQ5_28970 [Streptomyces sp. NPDC005794]|uniref:hypothetical protein n=1 Tax=Streptomyces sp. NPDC005794 TaxID=3364733 RepID=UPI0036AC0D21
MVVDVYRGQPWYMARPEPEDEIAGTLEASNPVIGPGNRPALSFVLRTVDDELPVYAAGVVDTLGPLAGFHLQIRGKTVDFTNQGGTRELWIATIVAAGGIGE